jgi:hypothetical protein
MFETLPEKHTRKSLPNPNPVKSSIGEHQPLPDLIRVKKKKKLQSSNGLETQKTPLAIAKDEKKSSPTLKRQGRKHHWGRKAWKPPPPQETNLPSVALSRVGTERNY